VFVKQLLILFVFTFMAYSFADSPFEEKEFKTPLREISIIATDDGFYPNKAIAYKGEKVKFFVTSTTDSGQCFVLQKHEVFVAAEKGKVHESEVILDNAGRFKFYCPANKSHGYLTVFEKFSVEEKPSPARGIASEKPTYWMPRDYD
jgi:hypothetical protein